MFHNVSVLLMLAASAALARFSRLLIEPSAGDGNPWWIWILVFWVLVTFAGVLVWWWLRADVEEEAPAVQAKGRPAPSLAAAVAETSAPIADAQLAEAEAEGGLPSVKVAAPPYDVEVTRAQPEMPRIALRPDDLKLIEGIGPKISSVLRAAGISTFASLATADVSQLRRILGDADPRLLRLADPTTWPAQAKLAADGAWEALQRMQDELKGGRRV